MNYCIYVIALLLVSSTLAAPSKLSTENLDITVDELESYLMGFLAGLHIDKYANATLSCKENFDSLLEDAFDAYSDIKSKKYYDGILSIADSLGETSPLARNCSQTTDQIILGIHTYINSFDSFLSWLNTVEKNVWSNFVQISFTTNDLVVELQKKKSNYTHVAELVGEVVYYSIGANQTNSVVGYTETDPLAPSPLNENVWIVLESLYEFLTSSKLVTDEPTGKCEGAIVGLILYEVDGYNNIKASNTEEGIFLIFDSFRYLHDIVEQCTEVGTQAYLNGTVVYETISENPDVIMANFKANMFHVLSGSAATYAQIYHKDIISLFKVFGGVVYQTLVEKPEVKEEHTFYTDDL